MKSPKTLDNRKEFVYKELEENIRNGSKISVISAYFTIYAYYELKKKLDKIESMRFIFKNPSFLKNKEKEMREYFINNPQEKEIFGNEFEIKLRNEMTQGSIAKKCAEWIEEKVEVKTFKNSDSSQPRMIHIENSNGESISINGSVDFTTDGLGLTPSNRLDLNMCVYDEDSTASSLSAFNQIWENDEILSNIKEELLESMQVIYTENPSEFLYFVSMYNIFTDYLDELNEEKIVKTRTGIKETEIWQKLYKFQKDAVVGAIDKIEKHNGCILADSVGLGKTFTALAIIKYYELRNDRVLVLVPKKIRENWTIYTQNDKRNIFINDRFSYDVLNHTDLSREKGFSGEINLSTINWGNYDLVVIDESHNFRNNPSYKDHKTRYERLMDDLIKAGVETKVLMLSATPVNNRMTDIKNQISFITEDNDHALFDVGLTSIDYILKQAQMIFNQWSRLDDDERTGERFVDMMDLDYFKLLDTLTIARSRKHIEKYYGLDEIGKFPKRKKPINKYCSIDTEDTFPPISKINKEIERLNLAIYSPLLYVLPQKRDAYSEKYDMAVGKGHSTFKQTDRELQIVSLMRINLLKRMESSIYSFRITIKNILEKIDSTLEIIELNKNNYDPDLDISLIDPEEEEYDLMMFGKKTKVLLQDIDLIKWKQDLKSDKEKLERILSKAEEVVPKRDSKLKDLRDKIKFKIENPINENNKKIIIFTAFADTANYLYDNLNEWILKDLKLNSALVTGSGRNKTSTKKVRSTDINDILTSFSPISKERDKIYDSNQEDINILIATDCISEGQNLQDCDYLINYDIHWNPVRIIQRFGRIDRIGSKNKEIQLVNFWPDIELDEYINLKGRVENRMIMVDVSTTGEENVIEGNKKKAMNDLKYRKKQLERLQKEVIDLEDVSSGISITDLTFNDFKVELMDYMKEHKKELETAPSGIYSIVKIEKDLQDTLKPGVIFLLRQINGEAESKDQNALSPYYLIYVNEDKTIEFNYTHSKKIMDYYKKLCSGNKEVYKDLVAEFNKETNDGYNMTKYSSLLGIAIENILGKKSETGISSLFSKGGTNLVKKDIIGLEEFELITFLILK